MSPVTAAVAAMSLIALAALVGVALRARDGRATAGRVTRFDPADAGTPSLGRTATLVQFSTETCARCPQVRRMLGALATQREGLAHVEVDLTHRPDLSARYRVLQTLFVVGVGLVLHLAGVPWALPVATAAAFLAAFLNAAFDFCLGCRLYLLLQRA